MKRAFLVALGALVIVAYFLYVSGIFVTRKPGLRLVVDEGFAGPIRIEFGRKGAPSLQIAPDGYSIMDSRRGRDTRTSDVVEQKFRTHHYVAVDASGASRSLQSGETAFLTYCEPDFLAARNDAYVMIIYVGRDAELKAHSLKERRQPRSMCTGLLD